jgi:lipopolysaccharide export LptBFGC system permease protein LptF
MKNKGQMNKYILWTVVCLILLVLLIALFYSSGISIIKNILSGNRGG